MSRKLGQDMLILIDDVQTACARNYDLDMDSEAVPLSSVQSGDYANSKQGKKSWVLSAEHLLTWNEDNFDALWNYWDQGTTVTLKLQDVQTDSLQYSGSGWIKTLRKSAPYNDMGKMNFVFIGTTPIVREDWNLIDGEDPLENRIDDLGNNLIT